MGLLLLLGRRRRSWLPRSLSLSRHLYLPLPLPLLLRKRRHHPRLNHRHLYLLLRVRQTLEVRILQHLLLLRRDHLHLRGVRRESGIGNRLSGVLLLLLLLLLRR